MAIDARAVATGMREAVPFIRMLGIEFISIEADDVGVVEAVVRLPDSPDLHNHLGGPHAGVLFTLGETACGAVAWAAFAHLLDRAVTLPVRIDIVYRTVASGAVRATARLGRSPADVVAELQSGVRPEFPVTVVIDTDDGTVTAEMTAIWTLGW